MKNVAFAAALAAAAFGAAAQTTPAPNPDRNIEAARSYGAFVPAPAPKAAKTETSTRRVNGSASRDWALRGVA